MMSAEKKQFAIVGNWRSRDGKMGLSLYECKQEGTVVPVGTYFEDVVIGQLTVDNAKKLVYFVDECAQSTAVPYYGGRFMAARVEPDPPRLQLVSEVPTLSSNPSYICIDKSGQYALVPHHVARNFVVRVVRDENGQFVTEKLYDQVTLCLFRLNGDGSIGQMCDVVTIEPENGRCPHLHSVFADPTSELFVACDKGLDKVHTFRIDRAAGKIVHMYTAETDPDVWPRYGVFHPEKPVLYTNNEISPVAYAWQYDVESGRLQIIQRLEIPCGPSKDRIMPSDIVISQGGTKLYLSIRGSNEIAVMDVDSQGLLTLKQTLPCEGDNPRGLALSPDDKALFCANFRSGKVSVFDLQPDGTLVYTGMQIAASSPGCVAFMEIG